MCTKANRRRQDKRVLKIAIPQHVAHRNTARTNNELKGQPMKGKLTFSLRKKAFQSSETKRTLIAPKQQSAPKQLKQLSAAEDFRHLAKRLNRANAITKTTAHG